MTTAPQHVRAVAGFELVRELGRAVLRVPRPAGPALWRWVLAERGLVRPQQVAAAEPDLVERVLVLGGGPAEVEGGFDAIRGRVREERARRREEGARRRRERRGR